MGSRMALKFKYIFCIILHFLFFFDQSWQVSDDPEAKTSAP